MSDVIISITNRIVKSNGGHSDEILPAKKFAELCSGCSRVLEELTPELRLCIEMIKIHPSKYWAGGQFDGSWVYEYEVRVILLIPDIEKFECTTRFGMYFHGRSCSLPEAFFLNVMESIQTKLAEHKRKLRREVNSIEKLLPAEVPA